MNIISYVKNFGSFSFDKLPFGEVDSVILSCVSYFFWEKYAPKFENSEENQFVELSSFGGDKKRMKEMTSISLTPAYDYRLLKSLTTSDRFAHVKIGLFRDKFNVSHAEQFAAMTFVLPNDQIVIIYRGTDTSIIGWKEDFEMALFDKIPSQDDALNYLNDVCDYFKDKKIFVSGHSKGGNLAMYAVTHSTLENKDRLIMARSHDGPGFRDIDSHIDSLIPILKKTSKTVPRSSIIGTLLGFRKDSKIVKSKSFFVLQHNPYKWIVDRKTADFVYLQYRSYVSIKGEIAMTKWLNSLNQDEKHRLIDIIFYILGADNNRKVTDLFFYFFKTVGFVIFRYRSLTKEDRVFFKTALRRFRILWNSKLVNSLIYKKKKNYSSFKKTIFDEDIE